MLIVGGVLNVTGAAHADNAIAAHAPLDAATPPAATEVTPASSAQPETAAPALTDTPSPAPAPAPSPPPAAPQASVPEAKPISALGDAHWSDSLGFVQIGEGKLTRDKGSDESAKHAPKVGDTTLNLSLFRFGVNRTTLNPVNDGESTSAHGITVLEVPFDFRFEWRRGGSLLVPWLDFGGGFMLGERTAQNPLGEETNQVLGITALRFGARFGLDVQPIEFVGVGPLLGARADLYRVSLEAEDSTAPSEAEFEPDVGLQYGIHARFRTRAKPGEPSRFYADPALIWRSGPYQTGQYASLDLGVRAGGVYFIGQYESRVGSSGKFTYGSSDADATTLSAAYAAAMPIEQRMGISLALVM